MFKTPYLGDEVDTFILLEIWVRKQVYLFCSSKKKSLFILNLFVWKINTI